MPLEEEFSSNIKKARISQGLSVADVARTTGLSSGDIPALEFQDRPSDRAEVRALAKVFGHRLGPLEQSTIKQ